MQTYREEDWIFLNSNSPADLAAEYSESSVILKEYDRCRNGHILVSDFFVNSKEMEFETVITSMEDGAGAGIYFGDGCYDDYVLAVVEKERVSVRIPNGAPLGDTFRYNGAKRYYEIGEAQAEAVLPLRLRIRKEKNLLSVWYNDNKVMECLWKNTFEKPAGRIFLQSVNTDKKQVASAEFSGFVIKGKMEGFQCEGSCVWAENGTEAGNVSLHIAGFRDMWTETDENGRFVFSKLPEGTYTCVAGKEPWGFWNFEIVHDGGKREYRLTPECSRKRESAPQGALKTNAQTVPLNGLWRFDWDKGDTGLEEQWFSDKYIWSRRIEVPFSWQSLEAFGEGFMANPYSLHQNCSWVTNYREMGNTAWYQRDICLEEDGEMELVLSAVSGLGTVWLDDRIVGYTTDSYNAFRFSLGELKAERKYRLTIRVFYDFEGDCFCRGKQGFWFTDAPGIWQNVWLERKCHTRISDILADYQLSEDNQQAEISLQVYLEANELFQTKPYSENQPKAAAKAEISFCFDEYKEIALVTEKGKKCSAEFEPVWKQGYYEKKALYTCLDQGETSVWLEEKQGKPVEPQKFELQTVEMPDYVEVSLRGMKRRSPVKLTEDGRLRADFEILFSDIELWSPENPYLYEVEAVCFCGGKECGRANRQLGIRRIETEGRQIKLNGVPVYVRGVLDQGYNPWGIYTYPCFEGKTPGSMEFDVIKAKEYGYNLIRMHIKDNEPEWYHICDKYGMMVWDEHPSNFYGVEKNYKWRNIHKRQLNAMIRKQNYHPSIVLFSIFNESWGITGDHEMSPWENESGQKWQKEEALLYKSKAGNVLAIDNSGYGKTEAADILDYHMYPETYGEAGEFFRRMLEQNYPGSTFNCYNQKNKELMQNAKIRELLQKTCRLELKTAEFKGEERQKGQPVIISEFVHTNQIEQLVRILPGTAGFTRMNLSSQENEDTSPLTSIRTERDFGFVHEDFSAAGYGTVNSENLIMADFPPLTRQKAGSRITVPIYISLWEKALEGKMLTVKLIEKGIDIEGREGILLGKRELHVRGKCFETLCIENSVLTIPEGMNGLYLFLEMYDEERLIGENSIQVVIERNEELGMAEENRMQCPASVPYFWNAEQFRGSYEAEGRSLLWMSGSGVVEYHIPVTENRKGLEKYVQIEISSCLCIEGTRLTDETEECGLIEIETGGMKRKAEVRSGSNDRRGLFSNSSSTRGKEILYKNTGKWGYGSQVLLRILDVEMEMAVKRGYLKVKLSCDDRGMIVYGSGMGRHGANPRIILENAGVPEKEKKESRQC